MQAEELYQQLEKDFIQPGLRDDWAGYMQSVEPYLTDNYKTRSMGLVCDHAREINSVYSAVFPTPEVMRSILDRGVTDSLLFVHHPSIWDIRRAPQTYQQMEIELLQQFRERRIAIYNLHIPLDNYGPYSTGVSLAHGLDLRIERPFAEFFGALAGILARTELVDAHELQERFSRAMGHRTSLYLNSDSRIKGGRVALAAGGGNLVEVLRETAAEGINTYLTGVTVRNPATEASHRFAAENGLNLLGGTHYSTEKPACQAMCRYFSGLGLKAEFVEGEPLLEDL